jgi:LysR family transcriptional regulator, glycine cleavage system transcriptional activator
MKIRLPPIQCLVTFETLSRLRSVTLTGEELNVTPSAVSHRVKQLEDILGTRLFGRADFSLTSEGTAYLARVREGLSALHDFPSCEPTPKRRKLRLAAPPTFARTILLPRLKQFFEAYPEIDLAIQVSIPLLDVVAEEADLMIRFGSGHYSDVEHCCLMRDEITPLAAPAFVRKHGLLESAESLEGLPLLRSPLEPWRTWFAAHGRPEPDTVDGSQFNDMGLLCDAASAELGVALVRLKLGASWLESGRLIRLFDNQIPSPHAHHLCWRTGTMDRWECAAFAGWLKKALA